MNRSATGWRNLDGSNFLLRVGPVLGARFGNTQQFQKGDSVVRMNGGGPSWPGEEIISVFRRSGHTRRELNAGAALDGLDRDAAFLSAVSAEHLHRAFLRAVRRRTPLKGPGAGAVLVFDPIEAEMAGDLEFPAFSGTNRAQRAKMTRMCRLMWRWVHPYGGNYGPSPDATYGHYLNIGSGYPFSGCSISLGDIG